MDAYFLIESYCFEIIFSQNNKVIFEWAVICRCFQDVFSLSRHLGTCEIEVSLCSLRTYNIGMLDIINNADNVWMWSSFNAIIALQLLHFHIHALSALLIMSSIPML